MKHYFGTFLALTLCLILFVYVKFLERPEKSGHQVQVYSLPRNTIDRITISEGKKALILERKNEVWWLRPQNSRAETRKVDLALADLASFEASPVDNPNSDLNVLGLLSPQKTIELHTTSGLGKTLEIGRAAPVGGNVFVKLKDRNEVYLLPSYKTNLSADPRQWQEPPETQPVKYKK